MLCRNERQGIIIYKQLIFTLLYMMCLAPIRPSGHPSVSFACAIFPNEILRGCSVMNVKRLWVKTNAFRADTIYKQNIVQSRCRDGKWLNVEQIQTKCEEKKKWRNKKKCQKMDSKCQRINRDMPESERKRDKKKYWAKPNASDSNTSLSLCFVLQSIFSRFLFCFSRFRLPFAPNAVGCWLLIYPTTQWMRSGLA